MKKYLLALLALTGAVSFGQNLSGEWDGLLTQSDKASPFTMSMTLTHTGKKLSGSARYSMGNRNVIEEFSGTVDGNKITITEHKITDFTPGTYWCVKNLFGTFEIDNNANEYVISGNWRSDKLFNGRTYYKGACAPGTFRITKAIPEVVKVPPPKPTPPKTPTSKPTPNAITSPSTELLCRVIDRATGQNTTAILTFTNLKTDENTSVKAKDGQCLWTGIRSQEYGVTVWVNNQEAAKEKVLLDKPQMSKEFYIGVAQPATVPTTVSTTTFRERKIEVKEKFDVVSDSLTLNFSDKGQTDGDIITVYYNKKLILEKHSLVSKAYPVKVAVLPNQDNEIIMYAENEGRIPPNTALLKFNDNGKLRQVMINSDTQSSGTIILRKVQK